MTTRIHVVNFGPDVVEAEATTSIVRTKIYPQSSADFYVYDNQDLTVRELKPEAPKS